MPFTCAVPTTLPPVEQFAPIPSAGPYYISAYAINQHLTALRNPNYHGSRPQRFGSLEYDFNLNETVLINQVIAGDLDYAPGGRRDDIIDQYGPDSPAAAHGLQQWFPYPVNCVGYMPLNTERPLFANLNMRLAVNYAVDRTAYGEAAGRYLAAPFDQYLPPGVPGYEDIDVYPAHPDLERARDLAGWHPGDPLRPITVYYRSSSAVNLAQYDIVRQNLEAIGFQVTGVGWAGGEIYHRMGIRGEPFDLGVSTGWCSDYSDPWDWMFLYDGTTIHDGEGNLNYSYFNDPVFNERMHAAAELTGDERYDAFRDIEHTSSATRRRRRPCGSYNDADFFSQRIGCQLYEASPYSGANLINLCLRPEITTDDTLAYEPDQVAHVPVRLSSEMDNTITVDYATADGTAHEGDDYVAAAGTLTFAPHERVKYVDVTINADGAGEPDETFFLNLSNESSGTMVDPQAVVTITETPASASTASTTTTASPTAAATSTASTSTTAASTATATAPPPPPPPPRTRCRVPRVIGMRLAAAKTRIRRAHCGVGRITKRVSARRVGRVISQTPRPGAVRARGTKVKLVVGRR